MAKRLLMEMRVDRRILSICFCRIRIVLCGNTVTNPEDHDLSFGERQFSLWGLALDRPKSWCTATVGQKSSFLHKTRQSLVFVRCDVHFSQSVDSPNGRICDRILNMKKSKKSSAKM